MNSSQAAPGSQASLREANRLRVLDALRDQGAMTQVEIAGFTGLSPATVSNMVKELDTAGAVQLEPSIRNGRRAVMVSLATGNTLIAGIAFGDRDVRAVGVGIPAPVDSVSGQVGSESILPGWRGVAVGEEMAGRLQAPVDVDNTSNLAALGVAVARPEDAEVALVRLPAPFDPRSDLFLESWFHQGSLDFPPGLVARLARIAAHCPLVIDVGLDRPAVVTPLLPLASALVGSFGTNDEALVDALTGVIPAEGRLPFDLPRSMEQVRRHGEDVPGYDDPLFAFGHGLTVIPTV